MLEGAERVLPEELVLVDHQALRADSVLRGGEPVVPYERHALDQRPVRAHHLVEPPEVVVPPGVRRCERAPLVVVRSRPGEALAGRPRQAQYGFRQALLGEVLGLAGLRPEARPPQQALRLLGAESPPVDGRRRTRVPVLAVA